MTTNTQITTRQLREILFYLENQDMTVRELRSMLYDVREQDKPLTVAFNMFTEAETTLENQTRRMAELDRISQ